MSQPASLKKAKSFYKTAKAKWNKEPAVVTMVKNATSNDPWGPHGSDMNFIANASRDPFDYTLIMNTLLQRLDDKPINWRKIMKAIIIMEFCSTRGNPRVLEDLTAFHAHKVRYLAKNFHFIDPEDGKDKGEAVRRKAEELLALIETHEAELAGLDPEERERRRQQLGVRGEALANPQLSSRIEGFGGGLQPQFGGSTYGRPPSVGAGVGASNGNPEDEDRELARAMAESMRTYEEHEAIRKAVADAEEGEGTIEEEDEEEARRQADASRAAVEDSMALIIIDDTVEEKPQQSNFNQDNLSNLLFGESGPPPPPQVAQPAPATQQILAAYSGPVPSQQPGFGSPTGFGLFDGPSQPQPDLLSNPQFGGFAPSNPFAYAGAGGAAPLAIGWHADGGAGGSAPRPAYSTPSAVGPITSFNQPPPVWGGSSFAQPGTFFPPPANTSMPAPRQPPPTVDPAAQSFLGKGSSLVDLSLSSYTPVQRGAVDPKTLNSTSASAGVKGTPMGAQRIGAS